MSFPIQMFSRLPCWHTDGINSKYKVRVVAGTDTQTYDTIGPYSLEKNESNSEWILDQHVERLLQLPDYFSYKTQRAEG